MTAKLTQPVGISSLARLLEACPGLGGVGCNALPKNRYISPAVPHPRAEPWRSPWTARYAHVPLPNGEAGPPRGRGPAPHDFAGEIRLSQVNTRLSCFRDLQYVINAEILGNHLLASRRPIDHDAIDFRSEERRV